MKKKNNRMVYEPGKPLSSRKQELFCNFYAFEFWGDPASAAEKAGLPKDQNSISSLLDNRNVAARIRFLRQRLSEQSIADEAWIKTVFINIILHSDKTSDKLRALASLHRAISSGSHSGGSSGNHEEDFPFEDDDGWE